MQPVIVTRVLAAPAEKVFAAWTQPELLRQWFAVGSNWVEKTEINFQTGGAFKIVIAAPEGANAAYGHYPRIEAPHLLEFTWQWEESSIEKGQSLITIEFESLEGHTKMVLTHTRLASELSEERHAAGWNVVLDRLVLFIDSPSPVTRN